MSNVETGKLHYVGVGASAGGLQAISTFLSSFERKENFCVIIVQHLSSEHKSELTSILERRSKWPVEQVTNGVELEAGKIYVAPPDKSIMISSNRLELRQERKSIHPSPSVDHFFESLAQEAGSKAIGVILSGYGKDGTHGAEMIKKQGGFIISQTPSTAQHPDMPQNVINQGYYDCHLTPPEMYDEIVQYIANHDLVKSLKQPKDSLDSIFEMLARKTGTDFSHYKPSTIKRRIKKRLEALDIENESLYLQHIKKNPGELENLFNTVLIGVTEFFRNIEAFEKLKPLLKSLLDQKKSGDDLRIWSVGCATGQEAYSVAMMIRELLHQERQLNIQIFATDMDQKALNIGRKGIYAPHSVENLSQDFISKYFDKYEGGYQIKKYIRQFVLFSRHDITTDPPFVKQDLIICRNLLIYFNNDLQKEALKTFHYALKPAGGLFLGKSESISVIPDLFDQVDSKNRIYRRSEAGPMYTLDYVRFRRNKKPSRESSKEENKMNRGFSLLDNAKETLFNYYEHPFVVINENFQVKELKGSLRLYLEMGEGKVDVNLVRMVNQELVMDLRALLVKIKKTGEPQESNIIKFSLFDQEHLVKMKVMPLVFDLYKSSHYMVIFEKIKDDPHYYAYEKDFDLEEVRNFRIKELEQELMASREHIQTFTEELETSNEELQSLNEELQSANEELKSSNEELETSNEELQSANEELHTANAELRNANEELIEKENEIKSSREKIARNEHLYKTITENFPNGWVGVINLDMKIEYIAGQGLENHSRQSLVGMAAYELNPFDSERKKLKQLFEKAFQKQETAVELYDKEQHVKVVALPLFYGKDGKSVEKVLFISQDVTRYLNALAQVKESEERFRMLADTAPIMIWMEDKHKNNIYQSAGWQNFTGTSAQDNYGKGWLSQVHPEDRERVGKAFNEAFDNRKHFTAEYRLQRDDGSYRWIIDHGKPRFDSSDKFLGYIGGCIDIHEQKEIEKKKDEFMNLASHELRTPLTAAKAYNQMVKQILEQKEEHELISMLAKMEGSLNRLHRLINELLDVSRIELGKVKLKLEELDMDELVTSILQEYSKIETDHQFTLENRSEQIIIADRGLLQQVFQNLLSNAVKFSPPGSEIKVDLRPGKQFVEVTVQDQGLGIKPEDQEKIFDKFYQIEESKKQGLGLGLYLVKGIVEAHKGAITVKSKPNEGAVFKFTLPLKIAPSC
ncbi:MAG: CheR family methyltransferase [Candidatus Cyclobacteriaceae bacterium M3_2C_046]